MLVQKIQFPKPLYSVVYKSIFFIGKKAVPEFLKINNIIDQNKP